MLYLRIYEFTEFLKAMGEIVNNIIYKSMAGTVNVNWIVLES